MGGAETKTGQARAEGSQAPSETELTVAQAMRGSENLLKLPLPAQRLIVIRLSQLVTFIVERVGDIQRIQQPGLIVKQMNDDLSAQENPFSL